MTQEQAAIMIEVLKSIHEVLKSMDASLQTLQIFAVGAFAVFVIRLWEER